MRSLLSRLERLPKPIKVSIIGIGSTGKGIFYQTHITPGIECVAIADIDISKAIECAEVLRRKYSVVETVSAVDEAIRGGRLAVCEDGELLCQSELSEVTIESSSSIVKGGEFARRSLDSGKIVVMMNAEADLIFGPALMKIAERNNVVYTSCDGDQHTCLRRLVDDIQMFGFQLVMAGNIKGFLDRYSNPTAIIPEADKRNLDYQMCASYTDGSKLCIEMSLIANAFGLSTPTPGMYGPKCKHVMDALEAYDLEALWKDRKPLVDYVLGAEPKGGVFVIGYTESEYQQFMLDWFPVELGKGPFRLFYRPYHLIHFESLRTVAEAYLDGTALLKPDYGFKTNVYAYAKKDLPKGTELDGIGGYAFYGLIENCADNRIKPGLPVCLAEDVSLKRDVRKDAKIYMEDLETLPSPDKYELYYEIAGIPTLS
jgi:predicted homoserine dehydrogenase-like protein